MSHYCNSKKYNATAMDMSHFPPTLIVSNDSLTSKWLTGEFNSNSEAAAQKKVLERCKSKGGTKCEVINVRNHCDSGIAIAANQNGYTYYWGGWLKKYALEQRALESCTTKYGDGCKILYSTEQ